ncbi:ATP-binding protein [Sphingomonas rosea]|uniref:histidine kinase n=1 Tax=Sphingomonas rosea TaxID=335605 RepID=A0ABP7U6V2_9SPHN
MLQIVSAAILVVGIWQLVEQRIDAGTRTLVDELRDDLLTTYRAEGANGLKAVVEARSTMPDDKDLALLLVDAQGRRLAGNIAAWPPTIRADGSFQHAALFRADREAPEQMLLVGTRLADGARLLNGYVVDDEAQLTEIVGEVLTGAMLLGLLLAAAGAFIITRLVTSRIRSFEQTSRAVAGGALSQRVPDRGSGDAFDRLGGSINFMLERIEHLVSELRLVTDGLAHDLRSPLTRLRANLERVSARTDDPEAQADLAKADGETRLLLRIVTTALEIARLEAGAGRERFAPVDPAALLLDLEDLYGPVAEEKGFTLTVEGSAPAIAADRQLLSQALGNLIENALRYAEPGALSLSVAETPHGTAFAVSDRGPGIAPDQRDLALARFGRLDPARHGHGAGLGLALVNAIAHLHGGELLLEDAEPGLRATILVARNPQPAAIDQH